VTKHTKAKRQLYKVYKLGNGKLTFRWLKTLAVPCSLFPSVCWRLLILQPCCGRNPVSNPQLTSGRGVWAHTWSCVTIDIDYLVTLAWK